MKISPLVAALLVSAASAQTLYVGEQEVDTADRDALARVVERCTALAEAGQDADTVSTFTQAGAEREGREATDATPGSATASESGDSAGPRLPLSIDVDGLASSGGEPEPAGEGTGTGVETGNEGDAPATTASMVDVAAITAQACKEAGIIY